MICLIDLIFYVFRYQSASDTSVDIGVQSGEEYPIWEETETGVICTSTIKEFHLETSKTINIDVPPSQRVQSISCLDYSETVNVNVPSSTPVNSVADNRYTDGFQGHLYDKSPIMMDKAEDVLRQRIRELEKLEKHLRQQVQLFFQNGWFYGWEIIIYCFIISSRCVD